MRNFSEETPCDHVGNTTKWFGVRGAWERLKPNRHSHVPHRAFPRGKYDKVDDQLLAPKVLKSYSTTFEQTRGQCLAPFKRRTLLSAKQRGFLMPRGGRALVKRLILGVMNDDWTTTFDYVVKSIDHF